MSATTVQARRFRPDGRSDHTLRPLACELSCLQNCDGSALWKTGSTHVLAAVHGPTAPRLAAVHEDPTRATLSILIQGGGGGGSAVAANSSGGGTSAGLQSHQARTWENLLAQTIASCCRTEAYPRTTISIILQIVSADGSILSAVLHAAVAALLDAGVEMTGLPIAVDCMWTAHSGKIEQKPTVPPEAEGCVDFRLDPNSEEEQEERAATMSWIFCAKGNEKASLLGCHTGSSGFGGMGNDPTVILQSQTIAEKAVSAIHAFLRLCLEQKVTRESQTLWSSS